MMSPAHHSTAAISNLIAASTSLQNLAGLSEDEFDRQMLDHVVSIRQLLSTEASISLANDETVLDVSDTTYIPCSKYTSHKY